MLRRFLDGLYAFSGLLAAVCIIGIALLIAAQIVSRFFLLYLPSADDFATMLLAAASFFGLAYTLRHGNHIRVVLLTSRLPPRPRWAVELFCLLVAVLLTGAIAFYTVQTTWFSWYLHDYTLGAIAIPKWIPQCSMAAGSIFLFIAFLDDLVVVLSGGTASYAAAEAAEQSLGLHE